MKKVSLSLLILSLCVTGTLRAETPTPEVTTTPMINEPDLPPSPCRIEPRNEHVMAGGKCPAGEVMTGIEKTSPLSVVCSKPDVRCDAPARFLAAEPPPPTSPVATLPEKKIELMPPPPPVDEND